MAFSWSAAPAPPSASAVPTTSAAFLRAFATISSADLFAEKVCDCDAPLVFGEVVSLSALDGLLKTGEVSIDEGRTVLDALQENYPAFEGRHADLLFVRRMGLSTALLVSSGAEVRFDRAARVIARLNLSECAESLRARIK